MPRLDSRGLSETQGRSPVGKVVLVAAVFFVAALSWRIYTGAQERNLAERLKKNDAVSIAALAADAKSSRGFAKDLEKGFNNASQRKVALSAVALGYVNDDSWAKELVDRGLKEWHPAIKRDLTDVLRPSPTRAAPKDLELLMRLVHDDDATVRISAGGSMIMYGSAAVESTMKAIQEGNCNELVEALGNSVLKGETTFVNALKTAATGNNPDIREHAMLALGNASPTEKAPPYMPILAKGLTDPVDKVAKAAAKALVRLGPAAMPPLQEALNSKQRRERDAAAEALKEAPALSTRLAADLMKHAASEDPELSDKMAQALLAVPPTDDLVKAMKSAASGETREKVRLRSVLISMVTNVHYPPSTEDCAAMQPVFDTLLDLPCDRECLAKVRGDDATALKDHPCFDEIYQPLLQQLGTSGARGDFAAALLGKGGGGEHKKRK
jgi:HEAT repeat protein